MAINGLTLRAERRAAEITVADIAARMSLSRQAIHLLERSAVLKVDRVDQYRKALADAIVASAAKVA